MSLNYTRTVYEVPLSCIRNLFDVRTAIDQDRMLQIAGAYQNPDPDNPIPPVKLIKLDTENEDEAYAYIDGRHRGEARKYLSKTHIDAVICTSDNPDKSELYIEAFKANWGGAKPPTREDISHTIVRLLEIGVTQREIREQLKFIPRGSLDTYMAWAKGVIFKRKMRPALDAVANGLPLKEVAERYKLKPEQIAMAISGKKGKFGGNEEKQIEREYKSYISRELGSANNGISKKVEHLLKKVDAGEVTSSVAGVIIHAWGEYLKRGLLRVEDWHARLNSISHEQDKAIDTPEEQKAAS